MACMAARERLADHVNVTISVHSLLPVASESTYLYCSADVSVCGVYKIGLALKLLQMMTPPHLTSLSLPNP